MGLFDNALSYPKVNEALDPVRKSLSLFSRLLPQGVSLPIQASDLQAPPAKPESPFSKFPDETQGNYQTIPMSAGSSNPQSGSINNVDDGLEQPQRGKLFGKENILSTILKIGLPAIASAGSGNGLIPGALLGYASAEAGNENKYQKDLNQYENEVQNDRLATGQTLNAALKNRDYNEKVRHNTVMESIKGANANKTVMPKYNKARYDEILTRIAGNDTSLTEDDLAFVKNWQTAHPNLTNP